MIDVMTETGFVTWSKDYRLKWTDFKAESNPAIFEDSHSVIKYGFTWLVNSDKLNDEIVFLIDNIEISVEFHPLLSWVRQSESSISLLKHEQGHFDLAEMIKRKHDKIFKNKFYKKFFPTRGQNDAQRKQFAKEDSGKMISNEVDELSKIFSKQRGDYDVETNFGKNLEIQLKYDQLFGKL
tara:strand:+ start:583 stop:1125 length:543 start_codon:yes stop_codon:yes gene_type:complete